MQTKPFDAAAWLRDEEDISLYLEFSAQEAAEAGDRRILSAALETAAKARGMMQKEKESSVKP